MPVPVDLIMEFSKMGAYIDSADLNQSEINYQLLSDTAPDVVFVVQNILASLPHPFVIIDIGDYSITMANSSFPFEKTDQTECGHKRGCGHNGLKAFIATSEQTTIGW